MKQLNENELRAEFSRFYAKMPYVEAGDRYPDQLIADYWLSKMSEREQTLREEIEGMKFEWLSPEEMKEHEGCRYHKDGLYVGQEAGDKYNRAIDDILALLSSKEN